MALPHTPVFFHWPHEEADPNEIIITRSMVEDMGHDRRHFTAKTLHQGHGHRIDTHH